MTAHEILTTKTDELEAGLYAALDGCDAYSSAVDALLAAELAKDAPNETLVKRLKQFQGRIAKIVGFVEDDALNEFLFLRDRLFTIELTENNKFI